MGRKRERERFQINLDGLRMRRRGRRRRRRGVTGAWHSKKIQNFKHAQHNLSNERTTCAVL